MININSQHITSKEFCDRLAMVRFNTDQTLIPLEHVQDYVLIG